MVGAEGGGGGGGGEVGEQIHLYGMESLKRLQAIHFFYDEVVFSAEAERSFFDS